MTTTTRPRESLVEAPSPPASRAGTPPIREGGRPRLAPGRALGVGVVGLWLSVIVLLPLAALTVHSLDEGLAGFWDAVTAPVALASIRTTLLVSAGVALLNAVMGTLVAWVLVRDEFPGKRYVNALIDLPFALPTIVASIVLLSLYGPSSPIGLHLNATRWGLAVALAFVTLPFVVRSVQPVLLEMDRDVEEAAASLGASNATTFRRVVLPTLAPAILSGAGPRLRPGGGGVRLGGPHRGQHPPRDPGRVPVHPAADRDRPARQRRGGVGGAAGHLVPRALPAPPVGQPGPAPRGAKLMTTTRRSTITLRVVALTYVLGLLALPILVILYRTFEPGIGEFVASIRTPAAISALNLSLTIVAIVVPLNVVFGVVTAIALVRWRVPGRGLVQAVVDLPFAVSPIVVGVSLIMLWGASGWFGGLEGSTGIRVIFGLPGMVLATLFVTLPFVVREVEPVLHEIGTEQEQAASTLGASAWQTFWRITVPAIRWGLTYGVVLTVARSLGEFGAVIMVSSGFPGVSQTLTLLVHSRYLDDHNTYGAYAAATLLMGLAVATLLLMTLLDRKRSTR